MIASKTSSCICYLFPHTSEQRGRLISVFSPELEQKVEDANNKVKKWDAALTYLGLCTTFVMAVLEITKLAVDKEFTEAEADKRARFDNWMTYGTLLIPALTTFLGAIFKYAKSMRERDLEKADNTMVSSDSVFFSARKRIIARHPDMIVAGQEQKDQQALLPKQVP